MDFVNCSAKRFPKGCCGREAAIDSELGSCDHIYANLVECKSKGINTNDSVQIEPTAMTCPNERGSKDRKRHVSWTNLNTFADQSSPIFTRDKMDSEVEENPRESIQFSDRLPHDADFQCPRCGQRMEEPRLLPCLHPICLSCVYELMSRPPNVSSKNEIRDDRTYPQSNIYETCPLCDTQLPNANSPIPLPHYPLQHRLVMDTVRHKLVNRVLCDICTDEVLALIQCSTCLRNFCSECAKQHERQNFAEARAIKHLMRPLWEATKIRRTILCQTHPTHALRFYCVACQQVTCKECMWSVQHRGHASENAISAGKRACTYLAIMLQKAKTYLNDLLIQYNHNVFSTNNLEETYNAAKFRGYFENNADASKLRDYKVILLRTIQARERIQEFERLQKARHLLDAISLINDLLADGSEIEVLSLARIIVKRLNKLGVTNITSDKENEYWYKDARLSALRNTHSGIYHCCTFCSSGGKKEVICGCRGTMPGGYRGCGHGHFGHPGFNHWSCCGSILRNGRCLITRKTMHQVIL